MLNMPYEGGCQCQGIRYRCSAPPFVAYTCHCRDCQRLTSSAFATCMQVPAESFEIISGTPQVRQRTADDGNILDTYFCTTCGSALYSSNHARPHRRTIYIGTLDDPGAVEVSAHIWLSRKLPWVVLPSHHRLFAEGGDWSSDYVR